MLHKRSSAAAALSAMLVLAFAPALASAEPAGTWLAQLHEATEQVFEGWRGWWLPEIRPEAAVRTEEAGTGIGTRKEGCGMDPNGGNACNKKKGPASNPGIGRELIQKK
jgi:hypothetical protein